MMLKKMILLGLIVSAPVLNLPAMDLGLSFGPWSFIPGNSAAAPGLHAYGGLKIGITERVETELYTITEITPSPLGSTFFGFNMGLSLLGPRYPTYFNMVGDIGILYGLETGNLRTTRFVTLRLSPLVIGNPYYRHRDRMFTLGLLYDMDNRRLSFTWNVLIFELFLLSDDHYVNPHRG